MSRRKLKVSNLFDLLAAVVSFYPSLGYGCRIQSMAFDVFTVSDGCKSILNSVFDKDTIKVPSYEN